MSAIRHIVGSLGGVVLGIGDPGHDLLARNLGPGEAFVRLNALGNKAQDGALDDWWHLQAGQEISLANFEYLRGALRALEAEGTPQAALLEQVLATGVPFLVQVEAVTAQGAGLVVTKPLQFLPRKRNQEGPVLFAVAAARNG